MNLWAICIIFVALPSLGIVHTGIGGSGGGTAKMGKPKYVRAEVCDSDGRCRQVTYKIRENTSADAISSALDADLNCSNAYGDSNLNPCNSIHRIPNWLKKLNKIFGEVSDDQVYDSNELYRN